MKLYNYSKEQIEKAVKSICPRCKGFGSLSSDKGETCNLCNGNGLLWVSDSGWTRPFNGRIGKSENLF
jgi:DnaJ-class molecular chaperone